MLSRSELTPDITRTRCEARAEGSTLRTTMKCVEEVKKGSPLDSNAQMR